MTYPLLETSTDDVVSQAERTALTLAAIVEFSDDAIVTKDLNGVITSWNPAAQKMFGYTPDEAIGRSIKMIIPTDRQSEEDEVLRRVRVGERVDHFETIRQRKDGSLVEISLSVSPLKDSTGRIIGASKIARDISERRAAEEAIQQSAEIKDQFLTLVSHELRTPIAIIVGNGHLLSRRYTTLETPDIEQALADITTEGERLQRIIENVLMLTRVEGGEKITREHVQVERLVAQVIRTLERRRPERQFESQESAGLPPAVGEPGLVVSVLENLIGNADKYSPAGEAITVRTALNERREVEVHVLDRGIGFSGDEARDLFTPFFRSTTAKEKASGMGLGLAVCKRAVEELGGSLGAEMRVGGGADFWFSLPAEVDTPIV
ncbi:MAG: PAS domain S-box protein [bacterium]